MSTQLIDFDKLQSNTQGITLDEAKKEVARELKTRRSAYARWAKAEPRKTDKYAKQYQTLAAVNDILLTMTEEQWNRRMKAIHTHTGDLFS